MLSNQQIETFIYAYRQQLEALKAQQTSINSAITKLQNNLSDLEAVSSGDSTISNVNVLTDSYVVGDSVLHRLKHLFQAAVTFVTDVAIQGVLTLSTALGVASGGTGRTTFTAHAVLLGNTVSGINVAAPSSANQVLTDNGAGVDPSFKPAVNSFNTRTGVVALTSGDVSGVGGVLAGSSPTFNALTTVTLSMLGQADLAAVKFTSGNTTGAGSAALGANSPAITLTAPYTWLTVLTNDGSTAYIPVWK